MNGPLKPQGNMRQNNNPLLIISQSGRALAASARKAGLSVTVIDRFVDTDTRSLSVKCLCVDGDAMGIDGDHLQTLLRDIDREGLAGVVVGSGLERVTGLITQLQEEWPYYGNPVSVWHACNNPGLFTGILDQLEIRYPETQSVRPASTENWLVKQKYAAGGSHVKRLTDVLSEASNAYYQKYINGRNISVVFLADAFYAQIIGISEIEVVDRDQGDFRYAGALSSVTIAPAVEQQLHDIVTRLTNHLKLRGLCGIDVVIDDQEQCRLLELNPRPTATFELYEQGNSLLAAHISACQGQMPVLSAASIVRGQRVLYSDADLFIPVLTWPDWVTDRPAPEQLVKAGEPVCMVHAQGSDQASVRHDLQLRTRSMQEQFSKNCQAA